MICAASLAVSMLEARRAHKLDVRGVSDEPTDSELAEALADRIPHDFTDSEQAAIIAHARKRHARSVAALGDEAAGIESEVEDAAVELLAQGDFWP